MQKTLPHSILLPLAAILSLPAPSAAQNGDLLVVEKRADLSARNRLLNRLGKIRVTVNFVDAKAKEVTDYLQAVTGVNFVIASKAMKADDLPTATLQLKKIPITSLMGVYEQQTELRFTYRSGLVLRPKDEVKAFSYLRIYDVRAAVMPVKNFKPRYKLGLRVGEEEMVEDDEESKPLMFGMDRLIDLIKSNAVTESWDRDGVSIDALNGILLVKQTVEGHRKTREILVRLGAIPAPRRVVVRRRPMPLPDKKSRRR